ncbi:MAG: hypothetical protein ACI9P7_000094 [Candidatus Azotimanducaceae bacterium]|jgi:hypothetical protein
MLVKAKRGPSLLVRHVSTVTTTQAGYPSVADIFLSYAREDIDRVRPLAASLEKVGFSVWWDSELTPGEQFEEFIGREIQQAACVVVV